MTNELETIAVEILRASQAAGTNVYAFVQAQAPDVVAQQVGWAVWDGLFTGIACLFISIALLSFGQHSGRKALKMEFEEMWEGWLVGGIVCVGFGLALLSAGCSNLKESFLIHKYPKAYIVQTLLKIKQ